MIVLDESKNPENAKSPHRPPTAHPRVPPGKLPGEVGLGEWTPLWVTTQGSVSSRNRSSSSCPQHPIVFKIAALNSMVSLSS